MSRRESIMATIEANRREVLALEAHMSTMSSAQTDWACEQIDKLVAEIRELELKLTKL